MAKQATEEEKKQMEDLGFEVEDIVNPGGGDPPEGQSTPPETPGGETPEGSGGNDSPPSSAPESQGEGQPPSPPPSETQAPTKEELQQQILGEMFGNTYSSWEEAREKVGEQATELETLREEKQRLEQQASGRPLGYANERIALYNEFVKKTGIENYNVFNKLMNTDTDKLEDIDVMVMKEVIDKPVLMGQEERVRKMFERSYNLDPDQVEVDDLEINKLKLQADAATARKALAETKEGVKLPEETPPQESGAQQRTPEEKKALEKGWKNVTDKIGQEWKAFPLMAEGSKDPIINFEVPQDVKQNLLKRAYEFSTENGIELNKENVQEVFGMMQRDFLVENLPKILHAVSEKVRGMTAEEYDKIYHNPSVEVNNDSPPGEEGLSEYDQSIEDIYEAEKEALGG